MNDLKKLVAVDSALLEEEEEEVVEVVVVVEEEEGENTIATDTVKTNINTAAHILFFSKWRIGMMVDDITTTITTPTKITSTNSLIRIPIPTHLHITEERRGKARQGEEARRDEEDASPLLPKHPTVDLFVVVYPNCTYPSNCCDFDSIRSDSVTMEYSS